MQDHNATVMVQHPIPRSAPAMDGCQECLRESRGDRVMSHDRRTCPEASTWHVQFLLSWYGQYRTIRVYGRMQLLMYGYSPSSLRSLLVYLHGDPQRFKGASQTYSYPRVLCHPSGTPGAPPPLPECFPSSLYSSFEGGASSAARSAILASAFGKVPDAQRRQLGHMGYSPYPDVCGGIRLLCDSVRTFDAQHLLYRCRALQHTAFSHDHVPDHGQLHRGRGDSSVSGVLPGTRDRGEHCGATSNSVGV